MNKNPLYYEEIGDDFDGFMSEYDVTTRIRLIAHLLGSERMPGACLEVGCGTGRISEMLAEKTDDLTVSDISAKLSSRVGEKLAVKSKASDACDLQFNDASFDYVISSECIEHTPDPKKAISEMIRVLKPGGKLIVTSPNKLWYPALVVARLLRLRKYSGTENWIFPSEAKKLMLAHGLQIEVSTGCHLFPWQIPGAKLVLPFFDRFADYLAPMMINFVIYASKPTSATA